MSNCNSSVTPDTTENNTENSPADNTANATVPNTIESQSSDDHDPISVALNLRKQPLMELVSSEEAYVRRLRTVRDNYIPVISVLKNSSSPESTALTSVPETSVLKDSPLSSPPIMPDDLAARWRILWGNWIQMYEWHSTFLERLQSLVDKEPDKIPKLFIDSRSRLRLIYSKYCENHRKAALIADQHREYFEELRTYLNDKEDVVSYLIQPVQRIMRYQLPMAEIVKYTKRAQLPELPLWQKALDIMKEIPKDTQLILEAARIDGFPGVITALGSILIRGTLSVATSTREQLLEAVSGYKSMLQETTRIMGITDQSSPTPKVPGVRSHSTRQSATSVPSPTESQIPTSGTVNVSGDAADTPDLYIGNLKFIESRLFLFEQMLVVTEEVKPKRRAISAEAFAHSTYQFKVAINVNKMRFEPHWYNCSLPNGLTNADATAVDQMLALGVTPDDLRFAVQDQTPGRDFIYVIDPKTLANREAWVVQLRDIQRMQHEFLLALQDPKRFNTGQRDDSWDAQNPADLSHLPLQPDTNLPVISVQKNLTVNPAQRQRQQKWPSFTMRRANRLASGSSATGTKKDAINRHVTATLPESAVEQSPSSSLTRSLSAERGHGRRPKRDERSSICESKLCAITKEPDTMVHRKSSLNETDRSLMHSTATSHPILSDSTDGKAGIKVRNMFANLFGRNKSKQRSRTDPTQSHGTHLPSTDASCVNEGNTVSELQPEADS